MEDRKKKIKTFKSVNNNANEGVKTMAKIEKAENVLQKQTNNTESTVKSNKKINIVFPEMIIPDSIEYTEDRFWIWNPIGLAAISNQFMVRAIKYNLEKSGISVSYYQHIIKWARDAFEAYQIVGLAAKMQTTALKSEMDTVKAIESIYCNNDNEDFVLHRDIHDVGWVIVHLFFAHRLKDQ